MHKKHETDEYQKYKHECPKHGELFDTIVAELEKCKKKKKNRKISF